MTLICLSQASKPLEIASKRGKKGEKRKMDINTKESINKGTIPTRILNQIDKTKSPMDNYREAKAQMIEDLTSEEKEETVQIVTITKRK